MEQTPVLYDVTDTRENAARVQRCQSFINCLVRHRNPPSIDIAATIGNFGKYAAGIASLVRGAPFTSFAARLLRAVREGHPTSHINCGSESESGI